MELDPTAAPLPLPGVDELIVYLVGPGFGESQVVLLPGGLCIVVDSCMEGDENLTLSLLKRLGVGRVDLLVVTHPDLDHIRGLPELINESRPRRVWRYPSGTLRDLVAYWCRQDPSDGRLREVYEALCTLDGLEKEGVAHDAHFQTRPRSLSADCEVWCMAPTGCDQRHARTQLRKLVQRAEDEPALAKAIRDTLVGERALGDRPNTLSLALAIRHRGRRVLLTGDVENGRRQEPASGWKGVIMHLREDGLLHHVQEIDVVKLAHHGSSGAFHAGAWRLHSKPDGSTTALVAPFDRSTPPLPRDEVLKELRSYAGRLGVSMDAGGAFARALAAGWNRHAVEPLPALGPHLAVVLDAAGPARLYAGSSASFFHI